MFKKAVVSFALFCLTACGHTGREHAKFITAVQNGDFETAARVAADDDFYTDEASRLVRLFELGTMHYLKGEYCQALENFDQAHDLSVRLYTTSVSKNIAAQFAGDGIVPYKGEKYELSLLRFYQSLSHYRLYEQGYCEPRTVTENGEVKTVDRKDLSESEKRLHFNAARAAILDWNSLLTTYTNESKDPKAFKQDMLAKTYGAEIHDIYGSNGDRQIARQLYKDVARLLDSVYADYPSFAGKNAAALKKYAENKGGDLYADAPRKENVKIVLKTGLITAKKPEKVDFTIPWAAFLAAGSNKNLSSCLGHILPGQRISFEIPSMVEPAKAKEYRLTVSDASGRTVVDKPFVLTAPVSETAYKEYQNERAGIIAGKGTRLTAKYVSAVVSACSVFDPNDGLKILSAYAAFAASVRLIEATEYADVRYWGLLPDAVFQQSAALKKGEYTGKVLSNGKELTAFPLIVKDSRAVLVDLNLPNG